MGARGEAQDKRFETDAHEATAVFERPSEADWQKTTAAEKAAAAAGIVRVLGDAQLDRTATVLAGMPAMSGVHFAERVLIGNLDQRLGSIRATVGG